MPPNVVVPYPSAPAASRQNSSYPASVHPDYAGGRPFEKEMFTSGRYDMPEVYKSGMSLRSHSQTAF